MSRARDEFLARVRRAVQEGNRAGHAPALEPRGGLGYQGAGADPVACFAAALRAAGGQCHIVAGPREAAARVLELVEQADPRRVLLGRGELLRRLDLAGLLRSTGVKVWQEPEAGAEVPEPEEVKDALFAAAVGITGVDWLIAETGSIVLTTARGQARSLSLLPPLHIAVAERRQLLPDLFDLFPPGAADALSDRGKPLPACVTIITGPSKTGDIELRLVTGVHGPGAVHVVLLAG
jgi:L-lactate dehydrogenase complex protein LldG